MPEAPGPIDRTYELFSNDPNHPVIKLNLLANVRQIPVFVKRIETANLTQGEGAGEFKLWPTAHPSVTVERGEKLLIAVRIRSALGDPRQLEIASDETKLSRLERESNGSGYWLEITAPAAQEAGLYEKSITLQITSDPSKKIDVRLKVRVLRENLVVTAQNIDLGEVGPLTPKTARLGIRKTVGLFQVKSVSSTLPFLDLQLLPLVEGRNFVIRINVAIDKLPAAGKYEGILRVETDDTERPLIEIPVRLEVRAQ